VFKGNSTKENYDMSNEHYLNNPLTHQDRQLGNSDSEWIKSFDCTHLRPLIICRGPIRKEAIDVFEEMGISHYGILLSEKDSIVYQNALAPELRQLNKPEHVHRVPDYTGADNEERQERIRQIIQIAKENNYNAIFAGYGFMAEDENMVSAMEDAGLNFIGPCARTVHDAGLKDEAKRTALQIGVSVTPGINNATALTLLKQYSDEASLLKLAKETQLSLDQNRFDSAPTLADKADAVLAASYKKGIDLFPLEALQETIREQVIEIGHQYPENRIRLKCIGGGGGKGQRILPSPSTYQGGTVERLKQAADHAPSLVLEILNEVKATGKGDNKNILIELNIETTRHQEIQVLGNGTWSLSLGGRDCSLQMHEQKLLEVSVTAEDLQYALTQSIKDGRDKETTVLSQDVKTLEAMENEAERFAEAVGLDNVSTFECIVDRDKHFFMEMNTRIQVEHRVTELCYRLKFVNPKNSNESFLIDSLVEAMVLLAAHGSQLPKPERITRNNASVEARLNATNQALAPHAGGLVENWSDATQHEIRDDQGICLHNPDTDVFMAYHLAGAYDSNIALLLTVGENRLNSFERLAEVLRTTKIQGKDLATNLEFHYGLVNWFIGNNINARPTTRFIVPYISAVGLLKQQTNKLDISYAYQNICKEILSSIADQDSLIAMKTVLTRKQIMLVRPIEHLFSEPHILAGWLSLNQSNFSVSESSGKVNWLKNPIQILADTYHYLNMDFQKDNAASSMIWDHDAEVLNSAQDFYRELENRLDTSNFEDLNTQLANNAAPKGFDKSLWQATQEAHLAYQAGCEALSILPHVAIETDFYDLNVNDDLSISIPEKLLDEKLQTQMAKILVPPPRAKSDEILASSGGMFYSCEAPGLPSFVKEGDHFEAGQTLYIVEVMKMFNKVNAPFAGTIAKVLAEKDGEIIKKGQPLFKIVPDEKVETTSPEEIKAERESATTLFLDKRIKI